ncbi:MAG: S8 family serine peptidase [Bacteroidia bacterium]|nr:S8 family serine peptidase [Bacteroidia bacterium]
MVHRIKTLFPVIALILCTVLNSQAQKQSSEIIYFKSGQVVLQENQLPEAAQLEASAFNGNYYLLIQLKETITLATREKLTSMGVAFFDYIPNKAYLVSVPQQVQLHTLFSLGVRSITPIQSEWKTSPHLTLYTKQTLPQADLRLRISIAYFKNANMDIASQYLSSNQISIVEKSAYFNRMLVEVEIAKLNELIAQPWVLWADRETPSMAETNLPGKTLTRSSTIGSSAPGARNLTGQGVIVGVWDGGTCGVHVDFTGRETNIESAGLSQHATHVTGTIGGAGLKDPDVTGMAPKATLLNWDFSGDIPGEMFAALSAQNIVMTNNSYAYSSDPCATRGDYDQRSQDLDNLVNSNVYLAQMFAAGNFQTDNCAGTGANAGYRTVHSGSQASKNSIAVGAVDRLDAMSSFSAWGPIRDNRLKPEVVAVGVAVNSTNDPNVYASNQGTSMATPNVTGIVAQIYQRYRQLNSGQNPDAALIRGVLANTAEDLGNPNPDFKFGFGRVNALRAVRALEDSRYFNDTIQPGSSGRTRMIVVPANCKRAKIMLTWNDPAGSTTASKALVNDLDLTVTDGVGNSTMPWVLSLSPYSAVATKGRDSLNNIEQVTIDNPAAGQWYIKVTGDVNTGSSQKFFVTYEFEQASLDVTYPNGGEVLVPGATEYIRWDSKFVTGNVQLQYSADAGNSWINITTATASSLSYTWTVPSIQTAKALIRVRTLDSTISSTSDTTFTILGTAGGLTTKVCSNQINLTWGGVTGAVAYEPMLLENGNYVGKGITPSANRFFTFTGLTNGTEYWVTVRAIMATDSARGKRAIAVNATPAGTNQPPVFNANLPLISSVCLNGTIVLRTQTAGAATLTRVWQRSTNNGATWSTVGSNLDSLVLTGVTNTSDKYLYRMNLISSTCGNTITSNTTTLRVDTGLTIKRVPSDVTACHNAPVSFNYGSTSKSLPNTKWQFSTNGGQSWNALAPALFDTLITFQAPDTMNNSLIRAIASNGCDAGDTTASANLFVKQRLLATLSNDTFICFRDMVTLNASASSGAPPVTYNWVNMGNNSSYQIQPNGTAYYKIIVSDSCGASITDSVLIAVMVIDSSFTHNSSGQTLVNFNAADAAATTYAWNFGDGATASTKTVNHFYSANGNYTVCLTLTKGNCSTAKCQQISVTKTGTGPAVELNELVKIFPNPASTQLNINAPLAMQQMELINELGQAVYSVKLNGTQTVSVPLNAFSNGIYMVKITGEAGVITKKIFVLK